MVEVDLFVLTPVLVGFVAMLVGFMMIASNIKTTKQMARAALDKSMAEVKSDLKDYVMLKLDAMEAKVNSVRNEMRNAHELEARAKDNRLFFTNWNQRIEDRIDRLHYAGKGGKEEEQEERDG